LRSAVRVSPNRAIIWRWLIGLDAATDAASALRADVWVTRLRRALSALPLPAWPDGRIRLAVDVSSWLRPDAVASPGRSFCQCYGRGKGSAQMIPGWPYSWVAALEPGRTSWALPLDAVRLGPDDDGVECFLPRFPRVTRRTHAFPPSSGSVFRTIAENAPTRGRPP
jgi:hypothetical protein